MIDLEAIEDSLYTAWSDYLALKLGNAPQMLLANQDIPEGKLDPERVIYSISTPYGTSAKTVKSETVDSTEEEFDKDVMYRYILTPRITISVNAYSGPSGKAREIALQIREWFEIDQLGNRFFEDNFEGVVKQNTLTKVDDRTTFLETDYQQRFGFDCAVELKDEVVVREKTIESLQINKEEVSE